jgi:uncharacterized protein YqhQ
LLYSTPLNFFTISKGLLISSIFSFTFSVDVSVIVPVTVKTLPSKVKLASAFISLSETDVNTLLSAGFVYDVIPALSPGIIGY